MKVKALRIISLMLLLVLLLSSCGGVTDNDGAETTVASTTATTVDTTVATTASTTVQTEPLEEILIDRPDKEVINILMIGNSLCFYYVEELAGIAAANGKEINVCNLYYSGCSLEQHWNFYTNNEAKCQFWHTNSKGRLERPIKTLTDALGYAKKRLGSDWDVITLQQDSSVLTKAQSLPYAEKLYDVIKTSSPDALLYWHQQGTFELVTGNDNPPQKFYALDTIEQQQQQHKAIRELAYMVAEAEGVNVIPVGDAWEIAHADSAIGQTLCRRKGINNDLGDYGHEGDIGGGQYLNACVWYEVLMAESCIGNTWRPTDYELSEEKIEILQRAAHEAVAAVYGADYARVVE